MGFAIMLLRYVPPMGIYETLYAFWGTFGTSMGEPGTHPWSQGFPRTVQLPNGPAMPTSVPVVPQDLLYPKAWGLPALREVIATHDQTFYGATIAADNVMVFAGGRPALMLSNPCNPTGITRQGDDLAACPLPMPQSLPVTG
jgi:hypothetical protein